jgi:hypothetical protein
VGALKPINFSKAAAELETAGKNPFIMLERRPIFEDILAKRKEYSEWEKSQKK